ncbi:MAG TPA: protein-methionine-sulfoxide reductase catalytic subunit MsrP [Rhodospirillaceae bacterium]|nr:protein-methionine-sulfoxide reductase catalytic subunit MsrP [Candidatus Neomarinimicrobiota bacterium]HCX14130.1 protein-methionine-sulfoxide reductase catalytic subunit MsrP [Rhodospirillaceae bacterium]
MLHRITKASTPRSYEITPEPMYLNRRQFIASASATIGLGPYSKALAAPKGFQFGPDFNTDVVDGYEQLGENESVTFPTSFFSYNNFNEFGPDKRDPINLSSGFISRPWEIMIDGLCAKPCVLDVDDFVRPYTFESRVYRLRCTETWSMVIPWVGISLAEVVKRFEPLGSCKFIRFETVMRPTEMPNQNTSALPWPYVEALRLDEALNPLSLLAVGAYGQSLLNQNGPPIRLVVPWKYGFKSIKSIVRITFTAEQPRTAWNTQIPSEYGFWANVNPTVDHPRWSQATERRIGDFIRRKTLMFNGYLDEVAHMYEGMDLQKHF